MWSLDAELGSIGLKTLPVRAKSPTVAQAASYVMQQDRDHPTDISSLCQYIKQISATTFVIAAVQHRRIFHTVEMWSPVAWMRQDLQGDRRTSQVSGVQVVAEPLCCTRSLSSLCYGEARLLSLGRDGVNHESTDGSSRSHNLTSRACLYLDHVIYFLLDPFVCLFVVCVHQTWVYKKYTVIMKIIIYSVKISSISNWEVVDLQ